MTLRANADLTQLRQQMAALKPGVVTNAAETAAPVLARIIGYAELARSFLPQIRQVMERMAPPAERPRPLPLAEPVSWEPPVRDVPAPRWRRRSSWRLRGLAVALPVCAGLAAYAAWRFRPAAPKRRRAPPG